MGHADAISMVGRLWVQAVGVNPEPRSGPRPLQLAGSSLHGGSLALPPLCLLHMPDGAAAARGCRGQGRAAGFGPLQALGGSGRGGKYEPTPQV